MRRQDPQPLRAGAAGGNARAADSSGAEILLDRDRDKNPVVALREIAEERVAPAALQEALVASMQRVLEGEDDTPDAVGYLAASAEALRLTAAQPPRNQNLGPDYE